MEKIFLSVLNMSITGAYVIAVIILARLPLKKAPKIISYALWAVAGFRLVCPFSIQSVFSLLPFKAGPIPQDIALQSIPRINSGITLVDNAVSAVLPSATPAANVNPMQALITVSSYLWIFGVAVMLIYSFISIVLLKHRLHGTALVEDKLFEADNLKTPFVIGLFRPRIYIPASLSEEERRYIILHEQTHIRRHDHTVKMFAYLVLCLHWFNPLVWIAFILMGADMEMSCDERVMKELGENIKSAYSLSLVRVATGHRILNGSPLAFGEGGMKERIKNILNFKKHSRVIIIASVILAAVLIVGFAMDRVSEVIEKWDRRPMIMVEGQIYMDTGKQIEAKIDASTVIGAITSSIDGTQKPTQNGESNFGCEGARYAFYNDGLAVLLEDKWMYFEKEYKNNTYEPRKWLDYYSDEQMPWDSSLEMELPEYPNVIFKWTPEKVTAIASGNEKELFQGTPIWNVYLADLTGDGLPEFCATVSSGFGIIDNHAVIYDYASDKLYELSDRMFFDYILSLENGQLVVTQSEYYGADQATGSLAIVNGELIAIGIDRTVDIDAEDNNNIFEDIINLPDELYIANNSASSYMLCYDFMVKETTELSITVETESGNFNLGIKNKDSDNYVYEMKEFQAKTETDSSILEPGNYRIIINQSFHYGSYHLVGSPSK
jgi:beta-lactamase regulating signal transducer with metallopeptidase domain